MRVQNRHFMQLAENALFRGGLPSYAKRLFSGVRARTLTAKTLTE